ncbi:MAG: tryptophan halogenase family protein [Pseudomonadota bacterium]
MSAQPIDTVIIAGGGTAGWMTAAALSRFLPKTVQIRLIESDAIGTIGVGEATIPALNDFNDMLGIDEDSFVRAVGGSFKLGIEFRHWGRVGDCYFHPFSAFGHDIDGIAFHQLWLELQRRGDKRSLDEFTIGNHAARNARFMRSNSTDPRSPLSQLRHAYHIDAGRYAAFLRNYAQARGVQRIEGKIAQVTLDDANGNIQSLTLDDGTTHAAQLFVDCTGFRALLIGDALGTDYIDWSHWLPCDRAIAVPSQADEICAPHTSATAHGAGWQWRIPLQHRTGNGCVYASHAMSDDDAHTQLMHGLATAATDEPRVLSFHTGRRHEFWSHNCVAIGLSAGFLEPLESTSIHLIQEGISKLIGLFPNQTFDALERDAYNQLIGTLYDYVRDFIILHYHATERDDSPFWDHVRTMTIPDTLRSHIDLFKRSGRFFANRADLFNLTSWVAVLIGQRIMPHGADPLAHGIPNDAIRAALDDMHKVYQDATHRMPTHKAFIDQFCASDDRAWATQ